MKLHEVDLIGKPTPSFEQVMKKHRLTRDQLEKRLIKGVHVEREHTKDDAVAREIALDHLNELPDYYDRLKKAEK